MEEKRMGISGSGLALGATVTLRSVGHNADGMQTEPHASPRAHRAEIQPTQDVINQHITSQKKIFSPFLVSVCFFFVSLQKNIPSKQNPFVMKKNLSLLTVMMIEKMEVL